MDGGSGYSIPVNATSNRYSYVYIPYGTDGFVGDTTNPDGSLINSQGTFTLTQEGTGEYRLSVPGLTPNDAMLLLSANHTGNSADNGLNYAADGNDFLIRGFDGNGGPGNLQDTGFNFDVIPFDGLGDPAGRRAIAAPAVLAANFQITELNSGNGQVGDAFDFTACPSST